ncbi:MAG: DUF362 domain-containing protein [bacterium]
MTLTRRQFFGWSLGSAALAASAYLLQREFTRDPWNERVFIARVPGYRSDLTPTMLAGLKESGVGSPEIAGKRVLLKPNLVETSPGAVHINTHPSVVRAAAQAFLELGAREVIVGEGPGHNRDTLLLLEESGLADVLLEDRIPFVDLNIDPGYTTPNLGRNSHLKSLTFPTTLQKVDWIVSLAKMKTHHWVGVTLSMKNLFGLMPGSYHGWPKNLLHEAGITECILDITATSKPAFAIVDGIIGMEGDGPIMGTPKHAGVLVMGRNLAAVDATCARIMGVNPYRLKYLAKADGRLGPIRDADIIQTGETVQSVRTTFQLLAKIPAHAHLRVNES